MPVSDARALGLVPTAAGGKNGRTASVLGLSLLSLSGVQGTLLAGHVLQWYGIPRATPFPAAEERLGGVKSQKPCLGRVRCIPDDKGPACPHYHT